jgi:PDZ domain
LSGSGSQDSFAGAFGGGVEWKLYRSLWLRPSADYVFSKHNFAAALGASGPSFTQNNFRVGIGLVYSFGGGATESPRSARSTIASPKIAPGVSEAVLLGASGYQNANGFSVTSVRSGSPADRAGVKVGDVIMRIDRQIVHSAAEIDTAVGTNVTGTIALTYLIKGIWQTEGIAKIT